MTTVQLKMVSTGIIAHEMIRIRQELLKKLEKRSGGMTIGQNIKYLSTKSRLYGPLCNRKSIARIPCYAISRSKYSSIPLITISR